MKVNTIIIGAGRSGTTTLYEYLKNHHDICFSSLKEIHYFTFQDLYERGETYLNSFFQHKKSENIIATADTYSLIDEDAPKRISAYNPQMKFIVILRDPVERAYSNFQYSRNYGYAKESVSFLQSYEKEKDIIKSNDVIKVNNLGHFYAGLYYEQLKYWSQHFPKEQFCILRTKDLKSKPLITINTILNFLQVEQLQTISEIEKQNVSSKSRHKSLEQILLNRDHKFRKLLREMFPDFLKQLIFKSGIIDKAHKLNRKPTKYLKLSKEEYVFYYKYFEQDLESLAKEFKVDLRV